MRSKSNDAGQIVGLERVGFVMKDGQVVRNDLASR
jgi:hypothetical protein